MKLKPRHYKILNHLYNRAKCLYDPFWKRFSRESCGPTRSCSTVLQQSTGLYYITKWINELVKVGLINYGKDKLRRYKWLSGYGLTEKGVKIAQSRYK